MRVFGGVVSVTGGGTDAVKVAVTARASVIVTVQPAVPEHAPDHPANVEPAAAVAVRVKDVPCA